MRSLIMLGLMGGAAAVLTPATGSPPTAKQGQALCRRAPALPVLTPESQPPKPKPTPRWEPRDGVRETDDVSSIVVTGSRSDGSGDTESSSAMTATDVGALPDAAPPPMAPPMSVAAPPPPPPPAPSSTAPGTPPAKMAAQIPAGLLTAGDHDDLLNPELYASYVDRFLSTETLNGVPRVDTRSVLTIEVRDSSGRPVPFAPVKLTCADGNTLTLATVADGTAVFFPELDRLGRSVRVSVGGAERSVSIAGAAGEQRQTMTLRGAAGAVRRFDLAVVIDTTGSMSDELDYLKAELRATLDDIVRRHPGLDVRLALVPYRDKGDEYVTRTFPFTGNLDRVQADLRAQQALGGGDYPEAMEQAMTRAVALEWRPDAIKSLLLVADAPPHAEDVATTWTATENARAKRIQIVPVAASGVGEGAEYLMRAMAAATQSRYLFLTDDSGIGNPHAPPAIDCYLVTKLNALIRRVLDGQISGRRVEPDQDEVIRSVGVYDKGRCILPPDFVEH